MPGGKGPKFHQSGEWSDKILCSVHEELPHDWEDYAIGFARRYREASKNIGRPLSVSVSNPKPTALVMFAHIVVWRHAAAYPTIERMLGPYFVRIQDAVFSGHAPLDVVVVEPGHMRNGKRAQIGLCPSKGTLAGRRIIRFEVGGLGFILKTDKRPFEWPLNDHYSAAVDPVVILLEDPVEITANTRIRRAVQSGRLPPER